MKTIDIAEAIRLLTTGIGHLSDEDIQIIIDNKPFLNEVKKSDEYFRAVSDKFIKDREVAGGLNIPHLMDHVKHPSGQSKTVCTSAALAFFNIHPDSYHYSGHEEQDNAILRRNKWAVRSRKSKFKISKGISSNVTLGKIRRELAKNSTEQGHYKVTIKTKDEYHCIVLSNDGQIVVDTAPSETNNRCKVRSIYLVFRK